MTERSIRVASAALAVAGAAITAYLLYVRWSGSVIACSTGGCETVQTSRYAEIFGVPVAALGLAGYLAFLAASIGRGEAARTANAGFAFVAVAFAAYLLYVQVHLIGAVCDWCLASDAVTAGLAVLALLRLLKTPTGDSGPAPAR